MAERRSTSSPPLHPRDSVRSSNPNVFSDDYALEPLELTDTREPKPVDRDGSDDVASLPQFSETPRRSLSFQPAFESPTGSIRRSRGSQRSDGGYSISSRLDDHGSHVSGPPRSVASISESGNSLLTPHRSIRSISTFGFPRAQSPYQGATGPSHPYGMYPQDIGVARTPSVATTSTMRQPERSYSGPNGPTQPYAMYPQNTVPEDDQDAVADIPLPIAAGFPGLGQNYQRRLGPDGEDVDDLIGPDGYTEQLPPYSRYANGVPPKYSSGIGSVRRSTVPPVLTEDSQETLNNSETPSNVRGEGDALNPFSDSATVPNPTNGDTALLKDESGNFKERVREKTRRKVCCGLLPCWLLGVIILAIVIAVIIGGIIGGVLAHKRGEEKGRQEASSTVTVAAAAAAPTVIVNASNAPDAEPLPSTPSNLPPLPTGSYSVTLNNPSSTSRSCLTNSNQSNAWDCSTGAELSIAITMSSNSPQVPVISLNYPIMPNAPIRYGAQPPQLSGPVPLNLMENRDNPTRGPAYAFLQYFNKTVILMDDDLPGGYPPVLKRSLLERWFIDDEAVDESMRLHERADSQWPSNSIAKPTDKPWYCFWNGTVLEGFIFVMQDANSSAWISTTSPSVAATSEAYPQPTYQPRAKRQASPSLLPYPKMIKIEERRFMHNFVQPYCQQMQILNTGEPAPLFNRTTNQPIIVNLTEVEPPLQHQAQEIPAGGGGPSMPASTIGGQSRRRSLTKKDASVACECEWMSGL